MITKFYKVTKGSYKNPVLLASKNISCIPAKGTYIEFSGQVFIVENIVFNIDTLEYRIALTRI